MSNYRLGEYRFTPIEDITHNGLPRFYWVVLMVDEADGEIDVFKTGTLERWRAGDPLTKSKLFQVKYKKPNSHPPTFKLYVRQSTNFKDIKREVITLLGDKYAGKTNKYRPRQRYYTYIITHIDSGDFWTVKASHELTDKWFKRYVNTLNQVRVAGLRYGTGLAPQLMRWCMHHTTDFTSDMFNLREVACAKTRAVRDEMTLDYLGLIDRTQVIYMGGKSEVIEEAIEQRRKVLGLQEQQHNLTLMAETHQDQRRVVCAAMRYPNLDMIICSPVHGDPIMLRQVLHLEKQLGPRLDSERGFVDQFGVFYTTEQAISIAQQAGQINADYPFKHLRAGDLY